MAIIRVNCNEIVMNKKREPFEIIRGLALLLVLWAAVLMAVRLQLLFPRSVVVWLSQSSNPPTGSGRVWCCGQQRIAVPFETGY